VADKEEMQPVCACCAKKKVRQPEEYRLIHRLNRIEGQIRGIKGMIEKDAYCTDILAQSAAAGAALNAFNRELLSAHIRTCVAEDIKAGKDETLDDLLATLQKLMK
jgi:DNA-binding FrmR family transcriptional regulator